MIRESKKKSNEKESGRQCGENIALRVLHRRDRWLGARAGNGGCRYMQFHLLQGITEGKKGKKVDSK